MARLARLALAGQTHLIVQRALQGQHLVQDAEDRRHWLTALRESAASQRVALHAYALLEGEVHLLATPAEAQALGLMMQMLGRRHVGAFNRRHARRGTLFDGRFRGTVIEPGGWLRDALVRVDGLALGDAAPQAVADPLWSSAPHHLGQQRCTWLADPPEYWRLGNTPFDRESAFAALLQAGLPHDRQQRLAQGALHGWPVGSPGFLADLAQQTERPLGPRGRGRPRQGTGNAA